MGTITVDEFRAVLDDVESVIDGYKAGNFDTPNASAKALGRVLGTLDYYRAVFGVRS